MTALPRTDTEARAAMDAQSAPVEADEILLAPQGTIEVAAFVCDRPSGEAIAQLSQEQDLSALVQMGGIAKAIEHASRVSSPSLLIVDLTESTTPMAEIDRLAEVCEPGTSVIAVGAANDVTLFRDLLSAGVSDYLIKPISAQALGDAIYTATTRAAEPQGETAKKDGRIIAFIGARGGAGSTTVSVNSAWFLAQEMKKRTALVDLDLQFGAASLALDLEPGRGLREALENPARIDSLFIASAAVAAADHLFVLGAEEPIDSPTIFDSEGLELLLAELRQNFEYVLLDVPRHAVASHWSALSAASTIAVVTDMSLTAMRDTMRLVTMAKNTAPEAKVVVVANRIGMDKRGEINKAEFEKGIETSLNFQIPEDAKAMAAANHNGKVLAAVANRSKTTTALRQLSIELSGDPSAAGKKKSLPFWKKQKNTAEKKKDKRNKA